MLPLGYLSLPIHSFPLGDMGSFSTPDPHFCQFLELALVSGCTYSPATARLLPTVHHTRYCSYKLFSENPLKIAEEQLLL